MEGKTPERLGLNQGETLWSVAASEFVSRKKGFFESRESKVRRARREKCPKAMGKPRGRGCDPNALAELLTSKVCCSGGM